MGLCVDVDAECGTFFREGENADFVVSVESGRKVSAG